MKMSEDNVMNTSDTTSYKIVQTKNGLIRGRKTIGFFDKKTIYSFRGIPYAQPPVGQLRFMPPKPPHSWSGVKDALEFGELNVQYNRAEDVVCGSEDCLYLNVFTPATELNSKLPVIVYIHGGGYIIGSCTIFDGDFLCNNDVILVSFNYRLGPLGFLSLGTPEYPGNMGLKDQFLVLKWVHENITNFGGDPNNITLYGNSAGASSVDFHLRIPKCRKLFQKAILFSGSILNNYASLLIGDNHVEFIEKFALANGKNTQCPDEVFNFLLNVDAKKLVKETYVRHYEHGMPFKRTFNYWAPILKNLKENDPFWFDEESSNDFNVDIMIGHTTNEAYEEIPEEIKNPELLKPFLQDFKFYCPLTPKYYNFNSLEYKEISEEIQKVYFPNGLQFDDKNSILNFGNLIADITFLHGIYESGKQFSERNKGKIYYFSFDLVTELNIFLKSCGAVEANLSGATHCDDISYFLKMHWVNYEDFADDSEEIRLIKDICKIWCNFVKNGNPNPITNPGLFRPAEQDTVWITRITNTGFVSESNYLKERLSVWDKISDKYNKLVKFPIF